MYSFISNSKVRQKGLCTMIENEDENAEKRVFKMIYKSSERTVLVAKETQEGHYEAYLASFSSKMATFSQSEDTKSLLHLFFHVSFGVLSRPEPNMKGLQIRSDKQNGQKCLRSWVSKSTPKLCKFRNSNIVQIPGERVF